VAGKRDQEIRDAYHEVFKQVWSAVDRQTIAERGFSWQPSAEQRQQFELDFDRTHSPYDPTRQSHREALFRVFYEAAKLFVERGTAALEENVKRLASADPAKLRRMLKVKMPKRSGRPFVREKARARNLELAWFVVERIIPFEQLMLNADLKPGHHGRPAMPWDFLAAEWNRTHPHDPFGSGKKKTRGDNLKDEYYRAIRNSHLVRDLLSELQREVDQQLERLRDPRSWRKVRTLEALQAYLASERPQPRDSRTRPELVRSALARYGSWLWRGRPDEQSWRTKTDDMPLRPWFLEEAREHGWQRQRETDTAFPGPPKRADAGQAGHDKTFPTVELQPGMVALRCKARACNSASWMVVVCSSDGPQVFRGPRCKGCKVAIRLEAEGAALARPSASTRRG